MYTYSYIHIYRKHVYGDGVFPCLPHVHPIVANPVPNSFLQRKMVKIEVVCHSASGNAGLQEMIHPFKDTQMGLHQLTLIRIRDG